MAQIWLSEYAVDWDVTDQANYPEMWLSKELPESFYAVLEDPQTQRTFITAQYGRIIES